MGRKQVGLKAGIKEGLWIGSCVSVWAMWAMYLRFSSVWVRDRVWFGHVVLDCFPSLRTINMYSMTFVKKEHHHISQTTTLGAPPPLILGFYPSKRHAGQHCSCFYLGITRTETFFMASSASYLDIHSMIFSRFIVLLLLIIYEHHVISVRSCFILY